MANSKKLFNSNKLNEFINVYISADNQKEKDLLWNSITTPFIERILNDETNSMITFLYRKSHSDLAKKIYIDCHAVGLPLTPISELHPIPETDLFFLTLKLPNQLRTAYSFLKLDNQTENFEGQGMVHKLYPYPEFSGALKKTIDTVARLHTNGQVEIDSRNPKTIDYFDYHNPDKCFFKESILELPNATPQPSYLSDINLIKNERQKFSQEKRFFEYTVSFSDTSLKDFPNYQDIIEHPDQPPQLKNNGVKFKLDIFPSPVCRMAVIVDSEGNAITLHQLKDKS